MTGAFQSLAIPERWRRRQAELGAVAAMMAVYFFSYFLRVAVPGTIFDEIQTEFSLSASAVAGLGSVFLGVYAGSQLLVGVAADRFGGRRTLLSGGAIMAAGALAFPLARDVYSLYAARLLCGFGASFMYLSLVREVEMLFGPRHFPALLGIVLFGGYAGGMAGTLPFALLAAWLHWRRALFTVALLLTLSWIGCWLVLRRLPATPGSGSRVSLRSLVAILFARRNRLILAASLFNFPVYFVVQNVVGKKFLQDVSRLPSGQAAAFVLVMAGTTAIGSSLSGLWLRLTGYRLLLVIRLFLGILFLGTALLAAGVPLRAPPWLFLFAYILVAASVASGSAWAALIKQMNDRAFVAQSVAVLNGTIYLGVALLAWLSGFLLDAYAGRSVLTSSGRLYPPEAYGSLFFVMALCVVAGYLLLSRLPETWTGMTSQPPQSQ